MVNYSGDEICLSKFRNRECNNSNVIPSAVEESKDSRSLDSQRSLGMTGGLDMLSLGMTAGDWLAITPSR